jgi:hypothetical protein
MQKEEALKQLTRIILGENAERRNSVKISRIFLGENKVEALNNQQGYSLEKMQKVEVLYQSAGIFLGENAERRGSKQSAVIFFGEITMRKGSRTISRDTP